jgi:hypothetical protein
VKKFFGLGEVPHPHSLAHDLSDEKDLILPISIFPAKPIAAKTINATIIVCKSIFNP